MDLGLDGKIAVVTGAGSGIGRASALALAAEGCRVLAVDLDEAAISALAEEQGAGWAALAADVADSEGAEAIAATALERFGRLDVFVHCAGVYETGGLADVDAAEWDRVNAINLRGTYLCVRAAIAAMAPGGWGRVVTFSSMAAETGGYSAGPAYVASKSGVIGLTRSLAIAAGPDGITVNCLCPGIIETPMTAVIDPDSKRETIARTPLRRAGTPEDVAAIVAMLCSERAGFVTGAHLDVNGGLVMT
jgi:3-oxoacyl-[acyl-carrier protein] reductase